MSGVQFFYECPECHEETEITMSAIIPAKLWGPPERCYPAEGGEIDIEDCPQCGAKWDLETLQLKGEAKQQTYERGE